MESVIRTFISIQIFLTLLTTYFIQIMPTVRIQQQRVYKSYFNDGPSRNSLHLPQCSDSQNILFPPAVIEYGLLTTEHNRIWLYCTKASTLPIHFLHPAPALRASQEIGRISIFLSKMGKDLQFSIMTMIKLPKKQKNKSSKEGKRCCCLFPLFRSLLVSAGNCGQSSSAV